MAIDVTPIAKNVVSVTATTSGTAVTVATVPDGSTYNVRITATNNSGADAQKAHISQDGYTTDEYKKVNDGDGIILVDRVVTASGADIDFDAYVEASAFIYEVLLFDITTI